MRAVSARILEPRDLPDVLAVAFTAACLDAIGDSEALALGAGEDIGGHTPAAYVRLAHSLGMGRERFRLTLQGARWVTLPEASRAFGDPLVGLHLQQHLDRLSWASTLLHKDQDSGGTSPRTTFNRRVAPSATWPREDGNMYDDAAVREERVRADVTALDRQQQRAVRQGRSLGTLDWSQIRRLLGDAPLPKLAQTHPGMASRVRAAGIDSLADLLRSILLDAGEAVPSYRIKQEVARRVAGRLTGPHRRSPAITPAQVDTALARLAARGEVRRLSHGVYEATNQMKGAPENS